MKQILTITLFFSLLFSAKATHNRAGEILYKRIAPFTTTTGSVTVDVYTYSITVIKYTNDGPGIADRCVDTVYFGDGSKGVAPRINGLSACNCGTLNGTAIPCGSVIVNSPNYVVKYNVYSITHTYAAPGSYVISTFDPNRNQGIHNIPNSVNFPFYIESLMIIGSNLGSNSSPVLTNPPIDQATLGVSFNHNVGAIDADGDSLSYAIVPCQVGNAQAVSGYFFPETGPGGTFSINAVTGLLSWCSPIFIDEYNIAILVKEWRKNTSGVPQIIGSVLRDMQVLVKYGVVGINKNSLFENASVYPNPFNEKLEIDLSEQAYDLVESYMYANDGKLVFSSVDQKVKGKWNMPLNNIEPGIYLLRIKTGNEVLYKKVIKE